MEILKTFSTALFGNLSPAELSRYENQIRLEDWGLTAQEKIKNSRVFIAGAGGLVSAAAFNLVAAGVGYLRIVDVKRVCLPDLGDQMLYRERDLNKFKGAVLQKRLQEANPFAVIEYLDRKISDQNILKISPQIDLFLGDLNDLETAFVLNRAASKIKAPLILAWIRDVRGFITTLDPSRGICLECTSLYNRLGRSEGTMAPMSSIMGGLMSLEALHILGGSGPALLHRIFGYDGELCQCWEETIKGKPGCPICQRRDKAC